MSLSATVPSCSLMPCPAQTMAWINRACTLGDVGLAIANGAGRYLPSRRSEARPRPRSSALPPTRLAERLRDAPLASFHLHDVKQRRFFVPMARFCARVSSSSQRPTRNEGSAERREAPALNMSRSYSATPRLRGVGPPAQPGGRLSALHRGAVGQGPLPSPALPPAAARRLHATGLFLPGRGPGVSCPRVTSRGRRHSRSACRIVSGDAPHERG